MHSIPSTTFEDVQHLQSQKSPNQSKETGQALLLATVVLVAAAIYVQFQPFGRFHLDVRQGVLNALSIIFGAMSVCVFWMAASRHYKYVRQVGFLLTFGSVFAAGAAMFLPESSDLLISHQATSFKGNVFLGFILLACVFYWIEEEYLPARRPSRE